MNEVNYQQSTSAEIQQTVSMTTLSDFLQLLGYADGSQRRWQNLASTLKVTVKRKINIKSADNTNIFKICETNLFWYYSEMTILSLKYAIITF